MEETQVKERKCILLRIRGGKQFVLQCDVSVPWALLGGLPQATVVGHEGDLGELCSEPCASAQSDPELVQWQKELRDAQRQAQQLLQRVPRMQNKPRSPVVELSKVPFLQRSANGL